MMLMSSTVCFRFPDEIHRYRSVLLPVISKFVSDMRTYYTLQVNLARESRVSCTTSFKAAVRLFPTLAALAAVL